MGNRQSLWKVTAPQSSPYPPLAEDLFVDVVVVGAGITGLTCAYLLSKAGKKVAILEKNGIGGGESGQTTAHLTEVLDTRYFDLISDFGIDGARTAASASRHAIDFIERVCEVESIDCDYERVPAFLYSESGHEADEISREWDAADRAGLRCRLDTQVPVCFSVNGAIRFENQAQFHPLRYLGALARRVVEMGSYIYEQTSVLKIHEGEPCLVETPGGRVRGSRLVIAANVPINNRFSMHTKLAAYRSYAVAIPESQARIGKGLFWDMMSPYHYMRTASVEWNGRVQRVAIVGGEDHKTGTKEHTEKCYRQLEIFAREHFGSGDTIASWSGQIIEPVDGLPYIGRNPHSKDIFIATGFSGQGMTFGTVSGVLLSDLILGRANDWEALFSPNRFKPLASAVPFLTENVDFPIHILTDGFVEKDALGLISVPAGEGKIVKIGREAIAVYRDEQLRLHAFSPVCSHLGCHVHWNRGEKTWDCPCHGSRFNTEGEVLNGPALSPLQPMDVEALTSTERKRQGKNVPGEAA